MKIVTFANNIKACVCSCCCVWLQSTRSNSSSSDAGYDKLQDGKKMIGFCSVRTHRIVSDITDLNGTHPKPGRDFNECTLRYAALISEAVLKNTCKFSPVTVIMRWKWISAGTQQHIPLALSGL